MKSDHLKQLITLTVITLCDLKSGRRLLCFCLTSNVKWIQKWFFSGSKARRRLERTDHGLVGVRDCGHRPRGILPSHGPKIILWRKETITALRLSLNQQHLKTCSKSPSIVQLFWLYVKSKDSSTKNSLTIKIDKPSQQSCLALRN
jgi:hypothetical protein